MSDNTERHVDGVWCANLRCARCYNANTWQESEVTALRTQLADMERKREGLQRRVDDARLLLDNYKAVYSSVRERLLAAEAESARLTAALRRVEEGVKALERYEPDSPSRMRSQGNGAWLYRPSALAAVEASK